MHLRLSSTDIENTSVTGNFPITVLKGINITLVASTESSYPPIVPTPFCWSLCGLSFYTSRFVVAVKMQAYLIVLLSSLWHYVQAAIEPSVAERPNDSPRLRHSTAKRDWSQEHDYPVLVRRGSEQKSVNGGDASHDGRSPDSHGTERSVGGRTQPLASKGRQFSGNLEERSRKRQASNDQDHAFQVARHSLEGRTRQQKMRSLQELSSQQLPPDLSRVNKGTRTPRLGGSDSSERSAKSSKDSGSSARPEVASTPPKDKDMPTQFTKPEDRSTIEGMARQISRLSSPESGGRRTPETPGKPAGVATPLYNHATKLALWKRVLETPSSHDPRLRELQEAIARKAPAERYHLRMALNLNIEPYSREYHAFVDHSVATAAKEDMHGNKGAPADAGGRPQSPVRWDGPPLHEQIHLAHKHGMNEEEFRRYQDRTKQAMMKGIDPFKNERGRADAIAQSKSQDLRDVPLTRLYPVSSGDILEYFQAGTPRALHRPM